MVDALAFKNKLTKTEIEKLDGQYDDDGFYLLKAGGFYDPCGQYFNKDGYDEDGGRYDDNGFYIKVPERLAKDGISLQKPVLKPDLPQGGSYDEDNFYIMPDKSFYDPFGFYFDPEGLDQAGGKYDDEGYYVSPFDVEFDENDVYGDEEDDDAQPEESPDDALERQAIYEEHVVMAQAYARNQLKQNPETVLTLKIEGVPSDTNLRTENDILKKLLKKRIPDFQHQGMVLRPSQYKPTNTVYL